MLNLVRSMSHVSIGEASSSRNTTKISGSFSEYNEDADKIDDSVGTVLEADSSESTSTMPAARAASAGLNPRCADTIKGIKDGQ